MKEINLETEKICIITNKERYKEAERIFMKMVDMKEAQDGWYVSNHRFSNRDGKINRALVFKKEGDNERQMAALHLLTEPDMDGKEFDYIIALDDTLVFEGRYKKDIVFI